VGVGLAWLIVHHFDDSIYRSQIRSRNDTEAQRIMAGLPLMAAIPTSHAMSVPRVVLRNDVTVLESMDRCSRAGVTGAPVVDVEGRFEGTVTVGALSAASNTHESVGSLADAGAPTIALDSRLSSALESISSAHVSWVPVLDDDRHVVATLSISDLVQAYRSELLAAAERVSALGSSAGAFELTVTGDSGLVGQPLRSAGLPEGTLVTSIARNGQVLAPTGDVVLERGDCLSMLGQDATGPHR
jgi:CBS domain-containing protein